jgi:hypothetical protein
MNQATSKSSDRGLHQKRLRESVKRLVIELGYLEQCLERGFQDTNIRIAATGIDTAIDCLNEHIAR